VVTRRNFLVASSFAAAGVAIYSNEVARHEWQIAERTFRLRNLPPQFEGFRIVQISDIHLEEYAEEYYLREVVEQVNALAGDLVLVTGDFVSRGPLTVNTSMSAAARCGAILSRITCVERYGVLGNHDAIVGSRIVRDHMENNGLPLLANEYVLVERGGAHVYLAGLDNVSEGHPNLMLAVPPSPDAPVILMVHEPDYANNIVTHERGGLVDLIFSGHTHGGQVRVPGIRPLTLPPLGRIYMEGHFVLGQSQLYVNRGIGTVGVPFRLNCPPEITVATLRGIEG
jgi:predicted MPP superfamily phosphohydrolase